MLQAMRKSAGFTLIELLVVVIIVAVLAAVGVPLLSANVARARGTEAEAGLGTIRTAMRTYFVENNNSYLGATLAEAANNIGLNLNDEWTSGDLDGQFYDDNDYTFLAAPAAQTYCVRATGNSGDADAPGAAKAAGINRSMNEQGTIFQSTNCT